MNYFNLASYWLYVLFAEQTPPSPQSVAENIEDAMFDATFDASSQSDERLSSFSSSSRSQLFDQGRDSSPIEPTGRAYYNPKDEDFLLLEDLPGSGLLRGKAQESIRVINGEEIVVIEDFLRGKTYRIALVYDTRFIFLPEVVIRKSLDYVNSIAAYFLIYCETQDRVDIDMNHFCL